MCSHVISIKLPVYDDLRINFGDPDEDKNFVSFFTALLDGRDLLEEEDRMWPDKATAAASSVPGDRGRTPQHLIGCTVIKQNILTFFRDC